MLKFINVLILTCCLSACVTTPPKVVKQYDEFSKKEICRLTPYLIAIKGFTRDAIISMTLAKESKGNTICTIYSTIDSISTKNKSVIYPDSKVKFKLNNADGSVETLQFKEFGFKSKSTTLYGYEPCVGYSSIGTELSITMNMQKNDIKKLLNAKKVELTISTKVEPIIVRLSDNDINAFRTFSNQCM